MSVALRSCLAVLALASACAQRAPAVAPLALPQQPPSLAATYDAAEHVGLSVAEWDAVRSLSPLPAQAPRDSSNRGSLDPNAQALGRRLFFDCALSQTGRVACATCHHPARGFSNGQPSDPRFPGVARNPPSLWNVAFNRWFFWDGRKDSLWSQALAPFESEAEYATSRDAVVRRVVCEPSYRDAYEAAFGPIRQATTCLDQAPVFQERSEVARVFAHVGKAIAAFEETLIATDSKFDRFVAALRAADARGAQSSLSAAEIRGLRLFVGEGRCVLCHSGPTLSDGEFHDVRVKPISGPPDSARYAGLRALAQDEFRLDSAYSDDLHAGRARGTFFVTVTGEAWGQYKTPSLRNVATSAPYMHQGQLPTLRAVVDHYSEFEGALPAGHHEALLLRPLALDEADKHTLVAFLEALTDEAAVRRAADLVEDVTCP
jgi:cytochrome c peroxidase